MKNVVLAGPGKNSLTTSLMAETLAAVRSAGQEPIFLTGEGDVFSAGLNLKEVASLDVPGLTKFLGVLEELVGALYTHPAPVVAWVNGHAIAGGCVLAMCCDAVVMTGREGPRVGLNEVAIGLEFPPRTLLMVRSRLQRPALDRVVLEGALHTAKEALALGIVDAIGEEADARARLEKLASYQRDTYAAAKHAIRGTLEISAVEQRRFLEHTIPLWASPERKTLIRAVLRK
jgi:enoyl-CoA hydratase